MYTCAVVVHMAVNQLKRQNNVANESFVHLRVKLYIAIFRHVLRFICVNLSNSFLQIRPDVVEIYGPTSTPGPRSRRVTGS